MAKSEREYLLDLWDRNICPNCGKDIAEGTRVGSGKKSEGGFCSLDSYAAYYKTDLIQRAKKIAELAARHQNS
jgi:hypothetical protein